VPELSRPSDPAAWARLDAICAALPHVGERISHGEKAWFIELGKRGRQFATTWDHHHDDRNAVVMAAPAGAQQHLIDDQTERYFKPPYVGSQGWIGIYLDRADVDWDLVELHLRDAHATITERLTRK
jgi:predicted DNA-binding protein (MmcQ/YjbR family)